MHQPQEGVRSLLGRYRMCRIAYEDCQSAQRPLTSAPATIRTEEVRTGQIAFSQLDSISQKEAVLELVSEGPAEQHRRNTYCLLRKEEEDELDDASRWLAA